MHLLKLKLVLYQSKSCREQEGISCYFLLNISCSGKMSSGLHPSRLRGCLLENRYLQSGNRHLKPRAHTQKSCFTSSMSNLSTGSLRAGISRHLFPAKPFYRDFGGKCISGENRKEKWRAEGYFGFPFQFSKWKFIFHFWKWKGKMEELPWRPQVPH